MRRIFAVAIILLSYVIALAQERKPENDHVVVTMNDGIKVEGYVQKYWTDARLFKRVNYSFEMSPKPDGKNTRTYNAEQVESIEFVKKTDATGRKYAYAIMYIVRISHRHTYHNRYGRACQSSGSGG